MKTGIVNDPLCLLHSTPTGHPESPARLNAVLEELKKSGLEKSLEVIAPRDASEEEIRRCHSPSYLETARYEINADVGTLSTGDTNVCRDSWKAALRAAGCALAATDAVFAGKVRNAFAAVRPPGHHATTDRGMGFCILNNVALAARHAQKKHGAKRVLIVDWDVHHGNGTQEIFWRDGSVFFFSTHQWPFYPGTGARTETGAGKGKGATLNIPVPQGTTGTELIGHFETELVPAMKKFQPEFVIISAGFDARVGDPLGGLLVTDDDFASLTKIVLGIAHEHAKDRVISVLEGGYNLRGLASATVAHIRALQSGG